MLYKTLKIIKRARTSEAVLRNLQTGTTDTCFDDSAVVNDDNFSFMKVGEVYDCKIGLFGDVVAAPDRWSAEVVVSKTGVMVGSRRMTEVKIDGDLYLIPADGAGDAAVGDTLVFSFSRKDLIQVDGVIHGDYLRRRTG